MCSSRYLHAPPQIELGRDEMRVKKDRAGRSGRFELSPTTLLLAGLLAPLLNHWRLIISTSLSERSICCTCSSGTFVKKKEKGRDRSVCRARLRRSMGELSARHSRRWCGRFAAVLCLCATFCKPGTVRCMLASSAHVHPPRSYHSTTHACV
jgi:hypothetical protein